MARRRGQHPDRAGAASAPDETTVVFLNGAFGTERDWRHVLDAIRDRYRCITFDARGRGRSSQARQYSFDADLNVLTEVVAAIGTDRLMLVGWSHGAALSVRYAAQHLATVAGPVLVDGAFPIDPPTDAEKQQALKLFKLQAPLMRVMAVFGASARMSATQAADLNIELRSLVHTLAADYQRLTEDERRNTAQHADLLGGPHVGGAGGHREPLQIALPTALSRARLLRPECYHAASPRGNASPSRPPVVSVGGQPRTRSSNHTALPPSMDSMPQLLASVETIMRPQPCSSVSCGWLPTRARSGLLS